MEGLRTLAAESIFILHPPSNHLTIHHRSMIMYPEKGQSPNEFPRGLTSDTIIDHG